MKRFHVTMDYKRNGDARQLMEWVVVEDETQLELLVSATTRRYNLSEVYYTFRELKPLEMGNEVQWTHIGHSSMQLRKGFFVEWGPASGYATVRLRNGHTKTIPASSVRHPDEETEIGRFVESVRGIYRTP